MATNGIPSARMWRFAAIGAEFFSPILGGAILGYYLDEYFRIAPALAVSGVLLGTFIGMYRLVVELKNFQRGD